MRNAMRSYIIPMVMAQALAVADMRSKHVYSPTPPISYGGVGSLPRFPNKRIYKFTIKGHEIEAYSKKDAIKRLKYKGLL